MKKEIYSYNSEYLTCNGSPILPIMGEFHFSRYPEKEWRSALENMKLGGVEITATYVFWIHHEEAEREWDFSERRNLKAFLNCCREVGMKVWLRIGPWAHGECRNGGFPDWLVEKERRGELTLRTDDPQYLRYVDVFLPKSQSWRTGICIRTAVRSSVYRSRMNTDMPAVPPTGKRVWHTCARYVPWRRKGTGSPVCVGNRLGWCLCAGKFPAGAGRVCGCPVGKSYP